MPRYKSFRLGEIFKENEKGNPAPEIKIVADFNNDGFDDLMIENYENNFPANNLPFKWRWKFQTSRWHA